MNQTRVRHFRHGWVGTVHGSRGATADRSITHLESHRAMAVDARTTYVAISRPRHHAAIYTDSREKLADPIEPRSGERRTALEPMRRMKTTKAEPLVRERAAAIR